jgi:hypothetical protein
MFLRWWRTDALLSGARLILQELAAETGRRGGQPPLFRPVGATQAQNITASCATALFHFG